MTRYYILVERHVTFQTLNREKSVLCNYEKKGLKYKNESLGSTKSVDVNKYTLRLSVLYLKT